MAAARAFEALAGVRELHPQAKWLPLNKLHLTLVFLGQMDSSRVDALSEAVAEVAARTSQFDVVTGEAGGKLGGDRGGVAGFGSRRAATRLPSFRSTSTALLPVTRSTRRQRHAHI